MTVHQLATLLLTGLIALSACEKAKSSADDDDDDAEEVEKDRDTAKKKKKKKKKKDNQADEADATDSDTTATTAKASDGPPATSGKTTAPVTSHTQQTYATDGFTKIADNCSKPSVVMATAPNSAGADYPWTWARQALLANQQFKVVSSVTVPGEVSFETHLASSRFNNAWVLVARCNDGGTCNALTAMYRAITKTKAAQPVCGPLPMALSRATYKRPVLRDLGSPTNSLPDKKDGRGLCARLQACTVAMDPSKADSVTVGFDCQKAPSKFNVQCARKYPCAAVMTCLEPQSAKKTLR